MKLGIMQPYFFPYLGYFSLIKNTDKWVVFDTPQYINKGWVNRNRVLSPSKEGFSYITVPVVKHSRDIRIKDVLIDHSRDWKAKIMGQMDYYRKHAPHYMETKEILDELFRRDIDGISELNIAALDMVCGYLGIAFDYSVFSGNTMGIDSVGGPDEWSLEISKKMGASIYVNPPGGRSFFNKEKFDKAGIGLRFLTQRLSIYNTYPYNFVPGLSIIDVMMFNSPTDINNMLEDYELA